MTNTRFTPKTQYVSLASYLNLLWTEFNAFLPTEEDCVEEIYSRSLEIFLKCRSCSSENIDKPYGARVAICRDCRKVTFLTAGTFFHRMKNARDWLFAISLIERGICVSSSAFHEVTGYSQSSALILFKRIAIVVEDQMPDQATVVLSSAFLSVFGKRSRLTPANAHPRSEQEEFEKELDAQMEDDESVGKANPADGISEQERQVYDLLSQSPMSFDALCARTGLSAGDLAASLTMLELNELAKRERGDQYVRLAPRPTSESHSQWAGKGDSTNPTTMLISAFLKLASSHWRGISRRFLQKYLALFWCHIDRLRWQEGSLLDACLHFGKIRRDRLVNCVTPLLVKICPFPRKNQ